MRRIIPLTFASALVLLHWAAHALTPDEPIYTTPCRTMVYWIDDQNNPKSKSAFFVVLSWMEGYVMGSLNARHHPAVSLKKFSDAAARYCINNPDATVLKAASRIAEGFASPSGQVWNDEP